MLKRRVPTAEEERIARIRKAWLGTFAGLLVVVLLIVVWFGAAFSRRVEPSRISPLGRPDGLLVFRVEALLQRAAANAAGEVPAARRLANQHVDLLATGLAPIGEVYFYEDGGETRWLAFVSIIRPQRMYAHKISLALEESEAFRPASEGVVEGALGYYVQMPRGVVVSSSPEFEVPTIEKGEPALEVGALYRYEAPEGYLPPGWSKRLPRIGGTGAIELLWFEDQLRAFPPSSQNLPLQYFDPILPEPLEP